MDTPYVHKEEIHNVTSAKQVLPLLYEFIQPGSVVDVGCGLATWLKVFEDDFGVADVLGLDGDYLDRSKLQIDLTKFQAFDLTKSFKLNRKFDLAISLEVAEHLPPESADHFIESLCNLSDTILFSAAIPGQGGQHHLNEQFPTYWRAKFKELGFSQYDVLRPRIWNNQQVDVWYRQNMFMYAKTPMSGVQAAGDFLPEIHPDLWLQKTIEIMTLHQKVNAMYHGGAGVRNHFKSLLSAFANLLQNRPAEGN